MMKLLKFKFGRGVHQQKLHSIERSKFYLQSSCTKIKQTTTRGQNLDLEDCNSRTLTATVE